MLRRELLAGLAWALKKSALEQAESLIREQTASGNVLAAALRAAQGGEVRAAGFGKAGPDTVFLLASITKPMTATGLMILRDRGELSLQDPVRKYLPKFSGGERNQVRIRHLLSHTSGLPDMLPENTELRRRHAPLAEFVERTLQTPLLFSPGTQVKYQSMGILLASAIAEKISGAPFRDFLRKELFLPLGMNATSLGLGGRRIADTAQCQVPEHTDWDWNSPYWRDLGAPWGGAHSTTADIAKFLNAAESGESRILKPGSWREMITNQNQGLNQPWGIGWMLKPREFGRACSDRTFGHYGSTGTVAWFDPVSRISCVLLTTRPASDSRQHLLGPVSDLVSAASA